MIQSRFVRGSKCLDKLPKLLDLHRHAPARPYSSLEEDEDVFMVEDRRRLARLQIERQLQILGNEIRALGLPDENGPSHWTSESTLMNHDNGFQNPTPEEQTSSRLEEGILLDIENEKGPSVGRSLCAKFTDSMRCVPNALALITAVPKNNAPPRGLLVSSFNSVTVFPIPYVSFNIKTPSSTLDAIKDSRQFMVTVIESPHTAAIFAKSRLYEKSLQYDKLEPSGKLKPGNGAVVWMKCKWSRGSELLVGDHAVIVGEVLEVGQEPDRDLGDRRATVYWHGGYTRLSRFNQTFPQTTLVKDRSSRTKGIRRSTQQVEAVKIRQVAADLSSPAASTH